MRVNKRLLYRRPNQVVGQELAGLWVAPLCLGNCFLDDLLPIVKGNSRHGDFKEPLFALLWWAAWAAVPSFDKSPLFIPYHFYTIKKAILPSPP